MALPKVDYPVYNTTIPSNGEIIKFRPFNVREEKILLTASESNDTDDIANSLAQIIRACTFGKLDPDTLTTYDIEFLFLQIRMRSVSPEVSVDFRNKKCSKNDGNECEKIIPVNIDLEEVTVQQYDEKEKDYKALAGTGYETSLGDKIMLSDTVGVTLKHPSLETAKKIEKCKREIDKIEQTIFSCITSIFDSESTHTIDGFTHDELVQWYEDLPRIEKEKLVAYIQRLPRLRTTAQFSCPYCEYKEDLVFEGLDDFFS